MKYQGLKHSLWDKTEELLIVEDVLMDLQNCLH